MSNNLETGLHKFYVYFREQEFELEISSLPAGDMSMSITLFSKDARELAKKLNEWADRADATRFGN